MLKFVVYSAVILFISIGSLTAYIFLDSTGILVSYGNYLFQKRLKQVINSGVNEVRLKDLTDLYLIIILKDI